MEQAARLLLILGGVFLVGLVADLAARHSPLPRVTLLLLTGFAIGPSGFDLLTGLGDAWFPIITDIALVMIGFLLGQKLTPRALRERGRAVLVVSGCEVAVTGAVVFLGLVLVGLPVEAALLLGGIAPASAPAASVDVVRELGAKGEFSDTLLGVVAVDDAWGLIVFGLALAVAESLSGGTAGTALEGVLRALREVGGAAGVGLALGVPMAFLTGRLHEGEPTQAEALGIVLLCGGVSLWLGVSHILAAMVLGATVASRAEHHRRPFHAIEGIEWPFLVLFFLLAGASLHVEALVAAGGIGAAYVLLRSAGLVSGAWLGGLLVSVGPFVRRWIGTALLPQAGVALGLALLAGQRFPGLESRIVPVVIGSTVVFEVLGPVAIRRALVASGEAGKS